MYFVDLEKEYSTRFDFAKFMEIVDGALDSAGSYFLEKLREIPSQGYYRITNEEFRPDLVSYRLYKNTQYWWILLFYNGLPSNEDLVSDLEIQYPSVHNLEALYFSLTSKSLVVR